MKKEKKKLHMECYYLNEVFYNADNCRKEDLLTVMQIIKRGGEVLLRQPTIDEKIMVSRKQRRVCDCG